MMGAAKDKATGTVQTAKDKASETAQAAKDRTVESKDHTVLCEGALTDRTWR